MDRDTPLLLPPDLRDWVPSNHLAHFILDAVESIDVHEAGGHAWDGSSFLAICPWLAENAAGIFI